SLRTATSFPKSAPRGPLPLARAARTTPKPRSSTRNVASNIVLCVALAPLGRICPSRHGGALGVMTLSLPERDAGEAAEAEALAELDRVALAEPDYRATSVAADGRG